MATMALEVLTAMPRTAKVFMTNRSQAVRLPKEYQFSTDEVFIRKEGDEVILSPRPRLLECVPGGGLSRPLLKFSGGSGEFYARSPQTRRCRVVDHEREARRQAGACPDGP